MRVAKLVGVLVGFSTVLLLAQPAGAAKSAAPSSITVDQSDVVYGDTVTFTTTVPKLGRNTIPFISVGCVQGSTPVHSDDGYLADTFTLVDVGDGRWDGGAASCTATLLARTATNTRVTYDTLASVSFGVAS